MLNVLLFLHIFFAASFIQALTIGQVAPQAQPASPSLITHVDHHGQPEKEVTFFMFMAARNDLFPFAGRNIRQVQTIGSNEKINILIHLDIHLKGQAKVTKRFYVDRNKLIQVGPDQQMDSGNPNSLIDFVRWGHENYPAKHYCVDFWNHGTGFIDPTIPRTVNPSGLFYFNTHTRLIELDRRVSFIDFINSQIETPEKMPKRGICFDETTGNYLTNKKLQDALEGIKKIIGRKLDIIFFDACLMQMWEVLRILVDYADYAVGSQEVELGTGYNYAFLLEPFYTKSPTPYDFACHAVTAYERAYNRITNDYTQSAVSLQGIPDLDIAINNLATTLVRGIRDQYQGSVKEAIRISRNKRFCTQFDEQSYIDAHSFCKSLERNIDHMQLKNSQETTSFRATVRKQVAQVCSTIENMVIAKCYGKNLPSQGISIYFPERRIHPSCYNVPGIETNGWLKFVSVYLGT